MSQHDQRAAPGQVHVAHRLFRRESWHLLAFSSIASPSLTSTSLHFGFTSSSTSLRLISPLSPFLLPFSPEHRVAGLSRIPRFGLNLVVLLPSTPTLARSCCSLATIEPWGSSVYSNCCSLVGGSVLSSLISVFLDFPLFVFKEKTNKSNESTAVVLHHRWTNLHFAASTRPSPTLPSPPWAALSSISLFLSL